jgi:hypothetical protein
MVAQIVGEKPKLPPPPFVTLLRNLDPDGMVTPDNVGVNPQTGQVVASMQRYRCVDATELVGMFAEAMRVVVREEVKDLLQETFGGPVRSG